MARRNDSTLDLVAELPWPIGLVIGVLAFAAIRYGLPWWFESTDNLILQGFGKAASRGALNPLAWIVMAACWIAAGVSFLRAKRRRTLLDIQSSLDSVSALTWQEFELLVGEAFRRQGFVVEEHGGGGADGGIDLVLRQGGRKELVQCKQWRTRQIKVPTVREMWGLAAHHQADGVKIICVGEYTRDAAEFARDKPIELINGQELLSLIRSVQSGRTATRPIDALHPAGTSAPDCPKCGAQMVRRENRTSGQTFWGCPSYPRCRGTRQATPP